MPSNIPGFFSFSSAIAMFSLSWNEIRFDSNNS
jgi:hypothetical protein